MVLCYSSPRKLTQPQKSLRCAFHFPLIFRSHGAQMTATHLSDYVAVHPLAVYSILPWITSDHHQGRRMPDKGSQALVSDCITFILGHNTTLSGHFPSLKKEWLPHEVLYQSFITLFFQMARRLSKCHYQLPKFLVVYYKNKDTCVQREKMLHQMNLLHFNSAP